MRIIGGEGRGRKLKAPKGFTTRPTTDRVKEAVFNILGDKVVDAAFLDLFGGTGSIAIEAVSRGARLATTSEKDRTAIKAIEENIRNTGFSDKIKVYKLDAFVLLKMLSNEGASFDIIYLDPPYHQGLAEKALCFLEESSLIAPGGIVVTETSSKDQIKNVNKLSAVKTKKYGDIIITLYATI